MDKWKKIVITALTATVLTGTTLAFAACKTGQIENSFVTYDGITVTLSGKAGEEIVFPDVEREGYIFEGWYLTENYSGSPVVQATYSEATTYYAKWSKAYAVTLDTDGGILSATTVWLKSGANILSSVKDYVPVKGEYEFGGWYTVDDEPLTANDRMKEAPITLTAKYKAQYTVNVYLQNESLDGYTPQTAYETGYALIGEDFTPSLKIEGFEYSEDAQDVTSLPIDGNKKNNVFSLHFDRKSYTLMYRANYPDGTDESVTEEHYYGVPFTLADDVFEAQEGSRFLGWATAAASADYTGVIANEDFVLTRTTALYAVWNIGYSDMFGGKDYIYLNHDAENTATLSRGGVDIAGTYDEIREWYNFSSTTVDFTIHAKIVENGKFLYYTNRSGDYYLYEEGTVNKEVFIHLDQENGIKYYGEESTALYEGTYAIDENGYYQATLSDRLNSNGEVLSFTFILGYAGTEKVYVVRGSESSYGNIPYLFEYFPVITLDGFGNAVLLEYTSSGITSSVYSYSISSAANGENSIVTLTSVSGQTKVIRILEANGIYGFDDYDASLDRTYTDENGATLVLNGCSTAVYTNGETTFTGSFSLSETVFDGDLVSVSSPDGVFLFRCYQSGQEYRMEQKAEDYGEYYYVDNDGLLAQLPCLVINGGRATLYELNASKKLQETCSGTVVAEGESWRFTVEGTVSDWAEYKYSSLLFKLDTHSTAERVYYLLQSTDEAGSLTDYTLKTYRNDDGDALKLVSVFAVYYDGEGNEIAAGYLSTYTGYVRLNEGGGKYRYFALTEGADGEDGTFETLAQKPLVLQKRVDGKTEKGSSLIVSGAGSDGRFIAVYVETVDSEEVFHNGIYTTETFSALGVNVGYVHTFRSDDGAIEFKFTVPSSGSYFNYYATDEAIALISLKAIDENGNEDKKTTLEITDVKNGENLVFVYKDSVSEIEGTVSSETVYPFDLSQYETLVYNFAPVGGEEGFGFTLVSTSSSIYFLVSGESGTYEAEGGSTLEINGPAHLSKYTDADGTVHISRYFTVQSVNSGENAICMAVGEEIRYFDFGEGTFALRGTEWNEDAYPYPVIRNGAWFGRAAVYLDGYGNAVWTEDIKAETAVTHNGTYTIENGVFEIVFDETDFTRTYRGRLGEWEDEVVAFYLLQNGMAGSYLNEDDLSVIVLDDAGGAVRYSSLGVMEEGTYSVINDSLFYYENDQHDDAAMYTYDTLAGTVVKATYHATFYADDFTSLVFYANGVVLFDNANAAFFSYDGDKNEVTTYSGTDEGEYEVGIIEISEGTIEYAGKTYRYFDGKYVTLTDESGNTLEFQPTGEATFTVVATYTTRAEGDEKDTSQQYYLVLDYDEEGNTVTFLAAYGKASLTGSSNAYQFLVNYDLSLSLDAKSFVFNPDEYIYGLSAYDYTYLQYLIRYGSSFAFLFEPIKGYVNIVGERKDSETTFTIAGTFNGIKGTDNKPLTFEKGTLSDAGYVSSQNFGHLFTSEFTGSDGEIYHMNFYLVDIGGGLFTYIIQSLTRQSRILYSDEEGTVVSGEIFVYTTGFQFIKSVDEETGQNTYYEAGDEFYPTVKYRGETVCVANWIEEDGGWTFFSRKYDIQTYTDYYYIFRYTTDEEGNITAGSVTECVSASYKSEDGVTAYVLKDAQTGEIVKVYALRIGSGDALNTESVKEGDGFIATTEDGERYSVVFTEETDPESGETSVAVTVTKIEENDGQEDTGN